MNISIAGVGLIQVTGFPDGWRFLSERLEINTDLFAHDSCEVTVSAPISDEVPWLMDAVRSGQPAHLETPSYLFDGQLIAVHLAGYAPGRHELRLRFIGDATLKPGAWSVGTP